MATLRLAPPPSSPLLWHSSNTGLQGQLWRYRSAIALGSLLAAGCSVYYLWNVPGAWEESSAGKERLHRSNAVRRSRRSRPRSVNTQVTPDQPNQEDPSSRPCSGNEEETVMTEEQSAADQVQDSTTIDTQTAAGNDSREQSLIVAELEKIEADNHSHTFLELLRAIGKEKAIKEGYVHRGIGCNSCGITPIRGIRYHCVNCLDTDLCSQCESIEAHDTTHVFYKIRLPAPLLGNPRRPEPVWYPGKPNPQVSRLSKRDQKMLRDESGFEASQFDALWEQFRCLAATDWDEDPLHYCKAIDRRAFDQCFLPRSTTRPFPPNPIYDRVFSFYDSNGDGLVGFEEFLLGIACTQNKGRKDKLKRTFDGYDLDRDGFVDRRDFLRMFKSLFNLHKELSKDIIGRIDVEGYSDDSAHQVITGRLALSAAFKREVPFGDESMIGDSKRRDEFGDYIPEDDNVRTIREDPDDIQPFRIRSPRDRLAEGEQSHGQEVVYEFIEDSINELLHPLFMTREKLALEVLHTLDERKKFSDEISWINNAGFWAQMEPVLARNEREWRTNEATTAVLKRARKHKLLECVTTSQEFISFDPAVFAPSFGQRDPPPSPAESTHSMSSPATNLEPTADLEPAEPEPGNSPRPETANENVASSVNAGIPGLAEADLSMAVPVDQPSANPDNNLTDSSQVDDTFRSLSSRAWDDARLDELVEAATPSEGSETTTVNEASNETACDPKEQTIDTPPSRSAHEFADEDLSFDPTLPQNRERIPSPPNFLHDLMYDLRLHVAPPLERLKKLALLEMLQLQDAKRGGPGRINWEEFEEIMKGPKGQAHAFVREWVNFASF